MLWAGSANVRRLVVCVALMHVVVSEFYIGVCARELVQFEDCIRAPISAEFEVLERDSSYFKWCSRDYTTGSAEKVALAGDEQSSECIMVSEKDGAGWLLGSNGTLDVVTQLCSEVFCVTTLGNSTGPRVRSRSYTGAAFYRAWTGEHSLRTEVIVGSGNDLAVCVWDDGQSDTTDVYCDGARVTFKRGNEERITARGSKCAFNVTAAGRYATRVEYDESTPVIVTEVEGTRVDRSVFWPGADLDFWTTPTHTRVLDPARDVESRSGVYAEELAPAADDVSAAPEPRGSGGSSLVSCNTLGCVGVGGGIVGVVPIIG